MKPINRSYPPPARTLALLGLVAGLLMGIALALVEEWLRHEMQDSDEADRGTLEAISAARRRRTGSVAISGPERTPIALGGFR